MWPFSLRAGVLFVSCFMLILCDFELCVTCAFSLLVLFIPQAGETISEVKGGGVEVAGDALVKVAMPPRTVARTSPPTALRTGAMPTERTGNRSSTTTLMIRTSRLVF